MARWRRFGFFRRRTEPLAAPSLRIWRGSWSACGHQEGRVRKDYVEKVIESRFMRRANKCRRSKYAQRLCCDQPKRRSLRFVLSAITFALCCSTVPAQQPRASEYQVKAAYLLKFGEFVKWPPSTAADKNES